MHDSLVVLAVLGAAATFHVVVHRGLRQLWRSVLGRRGPGTAGVGGVRWARRLEALSSPLIAAAWLAAAYVLIEQVPVLAYLRRRVVSIAVTALEMPVIRLQERPYSVLDLIELPVLLVGLWLLVGAVTRVVQARIAGAAGGERGAGHSVALLLRYLLTFLGGVFLLQAWGVDLSSLAILGGVLGVGIGLGLQSLASNFVSGVVISLERPVQPGDFVQVGSLTGTVERIGARSTQIRTLDHVTILVPNSRFLESEVVNWSHADPVSRVHVPVGVAYGSNIRRVRTALMDAARSHLEVLADPKPRVEFRGFGDSALGFELLVWIAEPRNQFRLVSDLNYRIEENLRRHGVQVPFPQRDIHLRSPQIDRLLAALGERLGAAADAEDGSGVDAGGGGDDRLEPGFETDLGPCAWTDAETDALVERMRGADGLSIVDRRHRLAVHEKCFVGREAVDWLRRREGLTRDEAVQLGVRLMDRGLIHHVLDEHPFRDGYFFYRFRVDDPPATSRRYRRLPLVTRKHQPPDRHPNDHRDRLEEPS